ncbi:MAG: GPP34 family phosphoprotein [Marinilabiliaceae bacterium]|nr:GPP34 family phosphoprotein [Marinilabiliaceae bacterium]
MKISLIDQLTLLSLDDESGSFIADSMAYSFSLAGAILLELSLHNRIEIILKNKVLVKDKINTGDSLLDEYLNLIVQSKKEKTVQDWIQTIGQKADEIKQQAIDKLIKKKIITQKEEKILWFFTIHKYPAQNSEPEDTLKQRLNRIIEYNEPPQHNEIMLLSLVDICELHKEIFGKENAKEYQKKMKSIIKDVEISAIMNQTVKEVHAALQAALLLLISSTVMTTTIINN